MARIDLDVLTLTESEVAGFPLGVIQLDETGKILAYNAAQEQISGVDGDPTIGRNFFSDVAPCTAVRDFQGRFDEFVGSLETVCQEFRFTFRLVSGDKEVGIILARRPAGDGRIFMIVNAHDREAAVQRPEPRPAPAVTVAWPVAAPFLRSRAARVLRE